MNRLLRLLLLLLISDVVYGQTDMNYKELLTKTALEQSLVEKAVKDGLFLSQQSFQICDKGTGELFGLNGKKEFGVQYTIGIKVLDGFLLTDPAVRSWLYNSKFEKYKEKYDPVFYKATYSELKEKAVYDSLDYALTKQEALIDTVLYRFSSQMFAGKGFQPDITAGEKNGWVVWITAKQGQNLDETADVNYTIYKKTINMTDNKQVFDINKPNMTQDVLGGIYVVPVYPKIGTIEFRLCGIIAPQGDVWKIYCPYVGMADASVAEDAPANVGAAEDKPSELTPAGNVDKEKAKDKKKKKK